MTQIQTTNTLAEKLDHLFSRRRQGQGNLAIRDDFFTLLNRLGNPQHKLPPVIHVAGTNGKGSTIAFMRAIFEAAGLSVHAYTSPHLLCYHERFVLNGAIIDDARLEQALDDITALSHDLDLAFLELTPALGFKLFAENTADILLLETGLGGRLDHTNIIENPLATIITTISFDHTHLLGETIAAIAGEKAGIMKPGVPCIIGHQIYAETLPVFEAQAKTLGIDLYDEPSWPKLVPLPKISLVGPHQIHNAELAIAALKVQQKFALNDQAFVQGLKNAQWPARLQKIDFFALPSGWEFWLDGAHNDSGAMMLAEQIKLWAKQDRKPVHLITAMKEGKNPERFIAALAPHIASVTLIQMEGGIDPAILRALWQESGAYCHPAATSLDQAIAALLQSSDPGRILLTGSLYLAQMVL